MIEGIPSADVPSVWHIASPLIQKVLDRTDPGETLADVYARLTAPEPLYQLYSLNDWQAAAVTAAYTLPQYTQLQIMYVGGAGVDQWSDALLEQMTLWAWSRGDKYVNAPGRKGWAPIANRNGFKAELVNWRKQVTPADVQDILERRGATSHEITRFLEHEDG